MVLLVCMVQWGVQVGHVPLPMNIKIYSSNINPKICCGPRLFGLGSVYSKILLNDMEYSLDKKTV